MTQVTKSSSTCDSPGVSLARYTDFKSDVAPEFIRFVSQTVTGSKQRTEAGGTLRPVRLYVFLILHLLPHCQILQARFSVYVYSGSLPALSGECGVV